MLACNLPRRRLRFLCERVDEVNGTVSTGVSVFLSNPSFTRKSIPKNKYKGGNGNESNFFAYIFVYTRCKNGYDIMNKAIR